MKNITIVVLSLILVNNAFAQKVIAKKPVDTKKVQKEIKATATDVGGKTKLRIEKTVNGKTEIIEKEIEDNDYEVTENLDSLPNKSIQKKIIVRDSDMMYDEGEDDLDEMQRDAMAYHNQRMGNRRRPNDEFNYHINRIQNKIADLPNRMRPYVYNENGMNTRNNASIKGLDVFTNVPETNIINVKFYAPEPGDVTITVTNLEGEVVAKSKTKNFSGEYMGQLKIENAKKGTYFVVVGQNEDGISRKIKVF